MAVPHFPSDINIARKVLPECQNIFPALASNQCLVRGRKGDFLLRKRGGFVSRGSMNPQAALHP